MLQLILNPANGWEDIGRERTSVETLRAAGFYPLTALTAASVFMNMLWHSTDATVTRMIVDALITFVMYFVGYFFGVFILSLSLPKLLLKPEDLSDRRIHTFAIYNTALLEVITLITNCIPITLSITLFLPLFVLIVIYKGTAYMRVAPEHTWTFVGWGCLGLIAAPYLLQYLFKIVLAP